MEKIPFIKLACDNHPCSQGGASEVVIGDNWRDCKRNARAKGWFILGDLSYCPECSRQNSAHALETHKLLNIFAQLET